MPSITFLATAGAGGSATRCAARRCPPTLTALARYNPDGSLDSGFGSGGLVGVKLFGAVNALALKSDGDILVWNDQGAVAEFSANGSLESAVTPGVSSRARRAHSAHFNPTGNFYSCKEDRAASVVAIGTSK